MRVLIAAGGTGGHIIPAIAVADALKEKFPGVEIFFVGIGKPVEQKLIQGAGYQHRVVPFVPVLGGGLGGIVRLLIHLPRSLFLALILLRKIKPDVLIGFGGFPSFCPFIASFLLCIPRILHEQNGRVGVANKVLSILATRIFAVPGTTGFLRNGSITFLPNPVRKPFYDVKPYSLPAKGEQFILLIVGGSQGAVSLNTAILGLIDFFEQHEVRVVHQVGTRDVERIAQAYEERGCRDASVVAFIDDMPTAYEQAHLVICRAGAMTVAEVAASGRPAIFVPLPIAGGHQAENIKALKRAGGALEIAQDDSLLVCLRGKLQELFSHPNKLEMLAQHARAFARTTDSSAADVIADAAIALVRGNS